MSKSKAQGTAWETKIVDTLNRRFLRATRMPELGSKDEGDIEFFDHHGHRWVIEAKATQTLNVTRVLHKAKVKSGQYDDPDHLGTALFWKRLVKTGKKVRQPDGVKEVVVISMADFLYLVKR